MGPIQKLFINTSITLTFGAVTAWLGMYSLCTYDGRLLVCQRSGAYWIAAGAVCAVIMLLLMYRQYEKTQSLITRKRTANPIVQAARQSSLGNTVDMIFRRYDMDNHTVKEITLPNLEDFGWVMEFKHGDPVIVSQREFYYWLLDMAKLQHQLDIDGKRSVVSPLSEYSNPGIGRKRLHAYKALLEEVYAVEYLNQNVKRIKTNYLIDPWTNIVKVVEAHRPLQRI